jgi:predicted transcriptional regulator
VIGKDEGMVKLTVALSTRTDVVLTRLAERQETTKAQVVRRAIALLSYLEDEVARGGRVVVRRPEGETEIVLESTL